MPSKIYNLQKYGENRVSIYQGHAGIELVIQYPKRIIKVPLGIAQLAAGSDEWMRKVEMPCQECKTVHKIEELNEGGYCEPCINKDFE